MLINDLYTYQVVSHRDKIIQATVSFNGDHHVYEGHFPGFAITPGVVQVLIIQEILELVLDSPLEMTGAKFLKFTAMHEPGKTKDVMASISYTFEEEFIRTEGVLYHGEIKFLKFRGEFIGKAQ